jgi:hypothetical protein
MLDYNMLFRSFLDMNLKERSFDHSIFSKSPLAADRAPHRQGILRRRGVIQRQERAGKETSSATLISPACSVSHRRFLSTSPVTASRSWRPAPSSGQ